MSFSNNYTHQVIKYRINTAIHNDLVWSGVRSKARAIWKFRSVVFPYCITVWYSWVVHNAACLHTQVIIRSNCYSYTNGPIMRWSYRACHIMWWWYTMSSTSNTAFLYYRRRIPKSYIWRMTLQNEMNIHKYVNSHNACRYSDQT